MKLTLNHIEIIIDKDKVFKDPKAEAREELEEDYERRQGVKACPKCGEAVPALAAECPGCGADLRAKCEHCGLPLSGEEPVCRCEGFESEEQREEFFRTSPSSKQANRPGGGRGLRWLAGRRKRYGY